MSPQSYGREVELGPKTSYITSNFVEELGLLYTDEDDNDELIEVYGPLCWQGWDNDQGGLKKLMWYGIVKEFKCKATSA